MVKPDHGARTGRATLRRDGAYGATARTAPNLTSGQTEPGEESCRAVRSSLLSFPCCCAPLPLLPLRTASPAAAAHRFP